MMCWYISVPPPSRDDTTLQMQQLGSIVADSTTMLQDMAKEPLWLCALSTTGT